jgi:6-phosphofructokinase 1
VTEVIERSRTPAGSHGWVQVIEVMGRHAGHLALWSGVAGGADLILIPEHPFSYDKIYKHLNERLGDTSSTGAHRRDRTQPRYSVIVVAEGASAEGGELVTLDNQHDAFGHARLGGIAEVLAQWIRTNTSYDARAAMLGHPQRGGTPSPIDRIMGMMFGARAADALAEGEHGKLVSASGIAPACTLSLVEITSVLGPLNRVNIERYYDTERYHMKRIGM